MRVTAETKSATRQRILEAATALFRNGGWESTTTRAIATASGIATGTLFNYFQSKEAIAATLVCDALEHARQGFRPGGSIEEDLFLLIWEGLKSLREFRSFLAPVVETVFSPLARPSKESPGDSIRVSHLELVEELLAGHGIAGPLPVLTVQLYWTLYLGVLAYWAADSSRNQEDTLALLDQSLKLFIASLPTGGGKHGCESE